MAKEKSAGLLIGDLKRMTRRSYSSEKKFELLSKEFVVNYLLLSYVGAYRVSATDTRGCVNQDSVSISVDEDYYLNIYNVITPGGNGQNDVWVIENIESYPVHTVSVFDLSGKQVFYSENYQNDWEGDFNGELLPDGSYYFVVKIMATDGDREYKGALLMLRDAE